MLDAATPRVVLVLHARDRGQMPVGGTEADMSAAPRARRWVQRLLVTVVALVVGLAMVEAGLRIQRWLGPTPVPPAFRYTTTDGVISYEPGATFTLVNEARQQIAVAIDERGFRNPTVEPLSAGTVILLGDSFTAGLNTPEPETVAGRLRQAGLRVVNAGLDGTGTTTHAAVLERRFQDAVRPTVVLLFYLGNDFKDNYWADPLPVHYTATQQWRRRLAGLAAGCGWSLVCDTLRQSLDVSVYAVDPMGTFPLGELRMLGAPTAHQLHAVGVTRTALDRIRRRVEEQQGRLLVVGIPSKAQVLRSFREIGAFSLDPAAEPAAEALVDSTFSWEQPDRILASICDELGMRYLSLMVPFRLQSAHEPLYYPLYDGHWNAAGERIAAEQILAVLHEDWSAGAP